MHGLKRAQLVGAGVVLLGCVAGLYCVQAARSQWMYFRGKFLLAEQVPFKQQDALAEQAYALYPHSYHLSQWMAEDAWYEQQNPDVAWRWVRRGVDQNPYHLDLRWLEATLLGQEDPMAAAAAWEAFSERVFWNSWVLAGRVYWYAMAGQSENAQTYLVLLKGREHYDWAAESVARARDAARLPPR